MSDIRIVVAQRGWIYVGEVTREEHEIVIRRARAIRRWGTSHGLCQLADGPTANTVLDNGPGKGRAVRLHPLQIIHSIDCDPKAWEKHLGP